MHVVANKCSAIVSLTFYVERGESIVKLVDERAITASSQLSCQAFETPTPVKILGMLHIRISYVMSNHFCNSLLLISLEI